MLLSICLIIKNEALILDDCLSRLKPLAAELIVVDTGSGDDSCQIAKNHGAKLLERPWRDDYAAARNYALEWATGDWILNLDADEWIASEEQAELKNYLNQAPKAIYSLKWRQHPELPETQKAVLFPNHCGVFYLGRVHEIPYAPQEYLPYQALNLTLQHRPHLSPVAPEKIQAYRRLLALDLNSPDPLCRFHAQRHWAQSYLILNDDHQAHREFIKAWDLFPSLPANLRDWGAPVLEGLLFLATEAQNKAEYHQWYTVYAQYYPQSPLLTKLPKDLP